MKTFAVAEWEGSKTGDNILQQLKELGKKQIKLKNKRSKDRKLKKVLQKEKSTLINAIEGNTESALNLKTKKKQKYKKKSMNSQNKDNFRQDFQKKNDNTHKKGINSKIDKQSNKLKNFQINPTKQSKKLKRKLKLQEKLKAALEINPKETTKEKKKKSNIQSLREKMVDKLKAAKFRLLNEQIYTTTGQEMHEYFKTNVEDFQAYHEGYKQQVSKWPLNPLNVIIKKINKLPPTYTIVDFGCGEANLAKSVKQKVHSFDLVATNALVTACDMAHVPLENSSVDVAVFCLSLMGTNLQDYLIEANRVLKIGGLLKIAEVESRFESVEAFIKAVEKLGFAKTWKDLSHNLFYFLDFKKMVDVKKKKKTVIDIKLKPCLYKKR